MRGFLVRIRPYGPFVLRVMLGVLAISFALGKVFHGMEGFFKEVEAWHLPRWVAQAAAWGSLASGFLLLLGLFARLAALVLLSVVVVVAWKTKLYSGFTGGLDFPLLMLAGCISLLLTGAGRPSVDAALFRSLSDPP